MQGRVNVTHRTHDAHKWVWGGGVGVLEAGLVFLCSTLTVEAN